MSRTPTLVILLVLLIARADAQRHTPTTELAVDVVTLRDGNRLLGTATARTEREITLAVRRAWLTKHLPNLAKAIDRVARERREAGRAGLLERLDAWRAASPEASKLLEFLDSERIRLVKSFDEAEEASPPESEFLFVTLRADEVRRLHVQRPTHRMIALLAWRERLDDVESRPADSLRRELERRGVAAPTKPIDLTDRFPNEPGDDSPEGEANWSARRAVVEYLYVEPLDFQGTGNLLVRTTGEQPAGLEEVLAAFTARVEPLDLLNLVDPPKRAVQPTAPAKRDDFASAIIEAERRDLRGFRVTRVTPDLERRSVVVESLFLAKLPKGWQPVWRSTTTVDASEPRPELEARIAEDERVAEIARTIETLGLGGTNEVATAVRFGAATMTAQSDADDRFFEFTKSATTTLDAPWPTSK